jgi:hypothetical protein
MTELLKTAQDFCEISSKYPTSSITGEADLGYKYTAGWWEENPLWYEPDIWHPATYELHGLFFDFDSINDEIPAGSHIDSAYLGLTQIAGGNATTLNFYLTLRSGAWGNFTWNSQPADAGAGTQAAYLYGTTAGVRAFTVTGLIQWIVDNNNASHILRLVRNPNTISGSSDKKMFSITVGNHQLVINYTELPVAPTIGMAARVSDTQATAAWTNAGSGGTYASLSILRSTDGESYVQIASGLAASATGYTDTTVVANHSYSYKAVATNSAGTATSGASNTIYTTPATPTIGTATKTGATAATVTWEDNANSEEYFEVSRTNDGGENWTVLSATIAAGVESYDDASAPEGTVAYRVRALRGALASSYSATSNNIIGTTAPAAPTISAWGAYEHTGTVLRVSWQHNTIDGSAQSKAYITYTKDGAETSYEYTGALGYYDIPITGLAATKVVTAKVKTKGTHADYGAFSGVVSTIVADLPECAITAPAVDEEVEADLPVVVEWSYSDDYMQAYWLLHLYDADDNLLGTWTGTTELEQSISADYLEDDAEFTLDLMVRSGTGFESTLVERTFATDYEAPTVPTVQATFNPDTLLTMILVQNGATGALPATDHLELVRLETFDDVTETTVLANLFTSGSTMVDYLPRLDQNVIYRARAVAANGAYSYADAVVATKSGGGAAVNFGDGDAQLLRLRWSGQRGQDSTDDSEAFVFAGRELPVLYSGEHTTESVRASATVFDDASRTTMRALRVWRRACVYREPDGYRARVKVSRLGNTRGSVPGATDITVDLLVVE